MKKGMLTSANKKVSWKNQTFPSLFGSGKLVMAIVTVLVNETGMASSRIFRTQTGYRIQGTRSRVAKSSSHQSGGRQDCH